MQPRNKVLYFIASLLLLASCAKEGPTGPTGNAGPSLSGSISGHVKLYDQYGSVVTVGAYLQRADLYINGASAAVNPDSNGYYSYLALLTGSYNIIATDSGYATTSKSIQLVAGALNADIRLSAIPDSFVYGFHAYHNAGSANDSLAIILKPDTRLRYCIVFASSSPAVSNINYLWSQTLSISPTAPLVTYLAPGQDLADVGIASGERVYYAAYSYVVGDASVYENTLAAGKGQSVYNAVNAHPLVDSTFAP